MFKRNTRALGGAALCGALLVSGCANQMSQRSEHEDGSSESCSTTACRSM